MAVLTDLIDALRSGRVEVVDLTAPLHSGTPILQLPPPFANASPFGLDRDQPLRRARPGLVLERHPHLRAHRHPLRRPGALGHRQGRRRRRPGAAGRGWSRRPRCSTSPTRAPPTPTSCWRSSTSRAWEAEHGPLPDGGWLLYRTGWDARSEDAAAFLNADETGPHTPGISVECAPLAGRGVRR